MKTGLSHKKPENHTFQKSGSRCEKSVVLLDKACVMLLAGHASNITHVFDPKTSVISFTASLLDSDNDEMWLVATVTECKRAARMILNCSTPAN